MSPSSVFRLFCFIFLLSFLTPLVSSEATVPVTIIASPPQAPHIATVDNANHVNTQIPPPLKRQQATRNLHAAEAEETVEPAVDAAVPQPPVVAPAAPAPVADATAPPVADGGPTASAVNFLSSTWSRICQHAVTVAVTRQLATWWTQVALAWPTDGLAAITFGTINASERVTPSSVDSPSSSSDRFDHFRDETIWALLGVGVATLIVRDLILR